MSTTATVTASYTAPNGSRVVALRWQGSSYLVRQTPKLVTTAWFGTTRLTKKDNPGAFHALVEAAYQEWDRAAAELAATVTAARVAQLEALPTEDVVYPELTTAEPSATEVAEVPASPGAVAKATGMYTVGVSRHGSGRPELAAVYPDLASAERVAEAARAHGDGATTWRPCGHAYSRYGSADCGRCQQVQAAVAVLTQGGQLTGALRAAGVEGEARQQLAREVLIPTAPLEPIARSIDQARIIDAGSAARQAHEAAVAHPGGRGKAAAYSARKDALDRFRAVLVELAGLTPEASDPDVLDVALGRTTTRQVNARLAALEAEREAEDAPAPRHVRAATGTLSTRPEEQLAAWRLEERAQVDAGYAQLGWTGDEPGTV